MTDQMRVYVLEIPDRFTRRVLQAADGDDDGLFDFFEPFQSSDGEKLTDWGSPKMYLSTAGGLVDGHETYPARFPWVFVFDYEVHRRIGRYLGRWGQIVELSVDGGDPYWALNVTNVLGDEVYNAARSDIRLSGGLIAEAQTICFYDQAIAGNGIFRLESMPGAILFTEDAVQEFGRAGCSLPDLRQISGCLERSPARLGKPGVEVYEWEHVAEKSASMRFVSQVDPDIVRSTLHGESVAGKWNPPEVEIIEKDGRRKFKKTDFPNYFPPALSARAADVLGSFLTKYGELLPVTCGDEKYFLFNVLEVRDALDTDESVMRRLQPTAPPFRVDKWVFKTAALEGAGIFRLPRNAILLPRILFTGAVLDEFLRPELTGFTYQLLWTS